jgi:hypothetical protein
MLPTSLHPTFGITHPLGLPRPIDVDNFFGAKGLYFARNLMPIPSGCLAHFDDAVYRPHIRNLIVLLNGLEFGWTGPAFIDGPPRYCLLRDGVPAEVPADLRALLPEPPRVTFGAVLAHFDHHHRTVAPMQLLDVLTLVSEDLGPEKFAAATAGHPWVAEFMR